MNSFILYLLESGLCLFVFFTLYQIFLKNETYYQLNRSYLLLSLIFSLLVPLFNVTIARETSTQITSFQMEPILVSATSGAVATTRQIGIFEILAGIYFLVAFILLTRLIFSFKRVSKLYSKGKVENHENYKIILHSRNFPPFSFFNNIFISEKHYAPEDMNEIIEHEVAHARQMHSIDLVIAEVLKILQWFNPMAWYFKNMVTENHEFLADEAVLNRGFSPESYQLRILTQLFGIRSIPAVHNFNQSVTQKRLKMMEKSKSSIASRLKIILALPVAVMLFYMFACTSGPTDLSAKSQPESDQNDKVYTKVEQMAEPDGGVMAFRKEIAKNILYPAEAKNKGVQGKVFIQFIIDEQGKIVKAVQSSKIPSASKSEDKADTPPSETVDIEGLVVAGYRPLKNQEQEYSEEDIQLLVNEAIRVIVESKIAWKPAMNDGKAVKSAWTIPITFSLQ